MVAYHWRLDMTDTNCKECDGEGYFEIQIAVDDTKFVACECNQPDADLEYDEWKLEH